MQLSKLRFLTAMGIFGTIGILVKYIPLSSAAIALFRGVTGVIFLSLVMLLTGKAPDWAAIRKNLPILCLSGAAMGFNWIALFESYRYTTVATATVCYYLAPAILLLASPLLGQKLTVKKLLCIGISLVGMIFVSGVTAGPLPTISEAKGILLGVAAAILYASVMFMNQKLSPIGAYDKTVLQLGAAAIVIAPYLLITQGLTFPALTGVQWGLLATIGVVHTGIAYALYFGSMKDLKAEVVAIFSYLDPVIAIVLSALVLGEQMTVPNIIGAVLILGSALYSELPSRVKCK